MTRTGTTALIVLLVFLFSGCATNPARWGDKRGEGMASWYGEQYHGKQTASGERYDMNALTAAHRTLPFDSKVQVTNKKNGREVTVRINDRGPNVRGRVIDVSKASAERLDMIRDGVVPVKYKVLKFGRPK